MTNQTSTGGRRSAGSSPSSPRRASPSRPAAARPPTPPRTQAPATRPRGATTAPAAELEGKISFLHKYADPRYAPYFDAVVAAYMADEPEGRDRGHRRDRPGRQGQAARARGVEHAARRLLLVGRRLHQEVRPRRPRPRPHGRRQRGVEGQLHPGRARGVHVRRQALRRAVHARRQVHRLQQQAVRRQRRRRPDDARGAPRGLRHVQGQGRHGPDGVRQPVRLAGHPLHDPAQRLLRAPRDARQGLRPGDRRVHRPGLPAGPRGVRRHQHPLPDPGRERHLARERPGQLPQQRRPDALHRGGRVPGPHRGRRRPRRPGRQLGLHEAPGPGHHARRRRRPHRARRTASSSTRAPSTPTSRSTSSST